MSAAAASPPWELLARQLAGEATPADEAAVQAWRAAAPANATLWQQLTGVWTETVPAASALAFGPADTAHAWQRFEANVLGPPPASPPSPASPAAPTPAVPPAVPPVLPGVGALAGWGKAAALLVAGAGAGWLLRTAVPPATEALVPAPVAARADTPRPVPMAVDLVFENEPVGSVARRLAGAFPGVRVVVGDSALARQRFTGTFRATGPAAVLRVVGLTTGADLTQRPDSAWVLAPTVR